MAGLVMIFLPVQVVVTQYVEEVPHNRCTQGRECFTANRYRLPGIVATIVKDNPEQDIVCLPTPCTALLNDNTLIAFD